MRYITQTLLEMNLVKLFAIRQCLMQVGVVQLLTLCEEYVSSKGSLSSRGLNNNG